MKRLKRTYSRCALWTLAALLLCMIAGSFFDLPLSKLLYPGHENSLGQFFAAFGELPAFLALTCSGCLLLVYRERINPSWSALTAVCGAALILMGLVLNIREASDNVPDMPVWVSILVTVFAAAATGAGRIAGTVSVNGYCQTETEYLFGYTESDAAGKSHRSHQQRTISDGGDL